MNNADIYLFNALIPKVVQVDLQGPMGDATPTWAYFIMAKKQGFRIR